MVCGFRVDANEEALGRTIEEPINDAVVGRRTLAGKSVLAVIDAFDFELFARDDAILRPQLCRKYDLSLG
jgi:hypothetical protein